MPVHLRTTPALFLAIALGTCGARGGRKMLKQPDLIKQADAVSPMDRMGAIALLEAALTNPEDPELIPWAMAWAGEQRRLSGDLVVARSWFEALAERYPTHGLRETARLGMALVDAEDSISGNTFATLQLLEAPGAPDTMNADRHRLLARKAADDGADKAVIREHIRRAVAHASGDPSVEGRVRATLGDLLTEDQTDGLAEPPEEVAAPDAIALSRAQSALAEGDTEAALALAQTLLETWPETALSRQVNYLIRQLEAEQEIQPGKVGVMLPFTGRLAPAAESLRQVIELANDGMELVYFDTSAEEADIVAGVEQLAFDEGCVAILGPLRKELVMEAAITAQAIGVPMVAMSQSMQPTEAGDFIFRGFLTLDQQIDAVVSHAMETRGLTRFAILHPETAYGQAALKLFRTKVEEGEGEIVQTVAYDPAAPDFLEPARLLGLKDYKERAAEYRKLKKDAEENDLDPDKVMLPPIIEYEAIFLPDNYRRTALVASALAYEEFPVGSFRPYRDAEPLLLMGLNAWNHPGLPEMGGAYVEGSIFVDAFLSSSDDPATMSFVTHYTETLGRAPGVLDAIAWDATRLLGLAVAEGGDSREQVRDSLGAVSIDDPVAGGMAFGEDREVTRELRLLTVSRKDGIFPWTPPEVPCLDENGEEVDDDGEGCPEDLAPPDSTDG